MSENTHELGYPSTVFTLVELESKLPFTADGPPAASRPAWRESLLRVEKEENWRWTYWGHDANAPNRICFLIGALTSECSRLLKRLTSSRMELASNG